MHGGKSRLNFAEAVMSFELPPTAKERQLQVRAEQLRALQGAEKPR